MHAPAVPLVALSKKFFAHSVITNLIDIFLSRGIRLHSIMAYKIHKYTTTRLHENSSSL